MGYNAIGDEIRRGTASEGVVILALGSVVI